MESGGSANPDFAAEALKPPASGWKDDGAETLSNNGQTLLWSFATGTAIGTGVATPETIGSASNTLKADASKRMTDGSPAPSGEPRADES